MAKWAVFRKEAAHEVREFARNPTMRMGAPQAHQQVLYVGHALTPAGGIPAAVETGTDVQMGFADCRYYTCDVEGLLKLSGASETIRIYNESKGQIAGGAEIAFHYNEAGLPVILSGVFDSVVAYTSGGAGARSGTTLGSGTAKLQKIDSGVISDFLLNGNPVNVTYYNLSTQAVSAGYIVLQTEKVTGQYIVVWEDCG